MVFLQLRRDSRVMTGNSSFLLCLPRKSNLPLELRERARDCSRVTSGQVKPHLCLCTGPNVPLQGRRGVGVAFQTHLRSQACYRGVAKDSTLLSSPDGYLLELTEWPKGSQASCGVWKEASRLLSRPCRKRRPSSRHNRGVSCFFSSCGASVVFLTR